MHILLSATLAIIMLGTGHVNAADNLAGGGAFGATCTDDSNGKTCSCTPPSTSTDCAKLLDNCANTVVDVDPWTDDLGHEHRRQQIPDVTCTATKCECAWIGKTSGGLPKPAIIQNQLAAPTKAAPRKPPQLKQLQVQPIGLGNIQGTLAPNKKILNRTQLRTSKIVAPRNAKCVSRGKGVLACEFSGKKYHCNSKRQNCAQIPGKPIRQKSILKKDEVKPETKVMKFDEADALFGKRTDPAKIPAKTVK